MNQSAVYPYVYDFLSIVSENCNIGDFKNIILFGSAARGNSDKKSDIDLFFDITDSSQIEKMQNILKKSLKSFESKNLKTWNLKGIDLPIKFIADNLNNIKWASLKEDIISNGISLFGKFEALPENITHHALFHFSLKNLKRKDKMKFLRRMFGYNNVKKGKVYWHKGSLEKYQGIKLGPNSVLFPLKEVENAKSIFKPFKIKTKIMEIWKRE